MARCCRHVPTDLTDGRNSLFLALDGRTRQRKGNVDLYNRLMEEALWGMDYVMKTCLGDGYRAQTWGTNLWTDGKVGTDDDAGRRELLVHNGALENFLLAGIEAYASMRIENDESLKGNLKKIAKEDFGYAMKRFNELGFAELIKRVGTCRHGIREPVPRQHLMGSQHAL